VCSSLEVTEILNGVKDYARIAKKLGVDDPGAAKAALQTLRQAYPACFDKLYWEFVGDSEGHVSMLQKTYEYFKPRLRRHKI
jgi:hypothetical protein